MAGNRPKIWPHAPSQRNLVMSRWIFANLALKSPKMKHCASLSRFYGTTAPCGPCWKRFGANIGEMCISDKSKREQNQIIDFDFLSEAVLVRLSKRVLQSRFRFAPNPHQPKSFCPLVSDELRRLSWSLLVLLLCWFSNLPSFLLLKSLARRAYLCSRKCELNWHSK